MSSSSSLSSARRRRVGATPVVQPHPTLSSSSQLSDNSVKRSTSDLQNPNSLQQMQTGAPRNVVNPTQLLMQHDYRLFHMEKLIKSIHSENNSDSSEMKNDQNIQSPKVNMNEIKKDVQQTILRSNELKNSIEGYAKNAIESSYDFNSFFANLEIFIKRK